MSWTESQVAEFYSQRGKISPAESSCDAKATQRHRKPKTIKLEPVSGPLEWSVTVHGHCPSKKNLWERRQAGVMVLPKEVKEQIAALTTQIMFAWRHPGPVEHPEITVKFYVGAKRQDRDGMYTTIQDCLQNAGVLVNDNIAHNDGRIVIEPCEVVPMAEERVEITIRKG